MALVSFTNRFLLVFLAIGVFPKSTLDTRKQSIKRGWVPGTGKYMFLSKFKLNKVSTVGYMVSFYLRLHRNVLLPGQLTRPKRGSL